MQHREERLGYRRFSNCKQTGVCELKDNCEMMAKNTRKDNLAWPVTRKEILKYCYKLWEKADVSVCRAGGSGKD